MKEKRALSVLVVVVTGLVLGWLTTGGPQKTAPADTAVTTPASPSPALTSPSAPGSTASGTDPDSGLPLVAVAVLPSQARDTLRAIDLGGPFRYSQDGTTFGNFEHLLPSRPRGYYTEYTVTTPGSTTRGARRIVAGEGGDFYYTGDHYSHFARITR